MSPPTEVDPRPKDRGPQDHSDEIGSSIPQDRDQRLRDDAEVYNASPVKCRRRTKAAIAEHRRVLYEIVKANRPCSVRQVYYLGIGRHWDKDTGSSSTAYNSVVRELGILRESGELPWAWISDHTRLRRIPTMWESWDDCLERTAETYKQNYWASQPRRVEVWCESDSIGGVLDGVTRPCGVALLACRGQSSKTFAWSAAQEYTRIGKPVTVLYVGDHDPSGLAIDRSLRERLERYTENRIEVDFRRVAVTPQQITDMSLTTHAANGKDKNYSKFATTCAEYDLPVEAVEVEALPPQYLRDLVESEVYDCIEDPTAWDRELDIEDYNREHLWHLAETGWSV